MESSAKVVGGMVVGALIGGALGILFAPYKGTETRRKLRMKSDEVSDDILDKLDTILDDFKKDMHSIVSKVRPDKSGSLSDKF